MLTLSKVFKWAITAAAHWVVRHEFKKSKRAPTGVTYDWIMCLKKFWIAESCETLASLTTLPSAKQRNISDSRLCRRNPTDLIFRPWSCWCTPTEIFYVTCFWTLWKNNSLTEDIIQRGSFIIVRVKCGCCCDGRSGKRQLGGSAWRDKQIATLACHCLTLSKFAVQIKSKVWLYEAYPSIGDLWLTRQLSQNWLHGTFPLGGCYNKANWLLLPVLNPKAITGEGEWGKTDFVPFIFLGYF